jgi:hypothetical protein
VCAIPVVPARTQHRQKKLLGDTDNEFRACMKRSWMAELARKPFASSDVIPVPLHSNRPRLCAPGSRAPSLRTLQFKGTPSSCRGTLVLREALRIRSLTCLLSEVDEPETRGGEMRYSQLHWRLVHEHSCQVQPRADCALARSERRNNHGQLLQLAASACCSQFMLTLDLPMYVLCTQPTCALSVFRVDLNSSFESS